MEPDRSWWLYVGSLRRLYRSFHGRRIGTRREPPRSRSSNVHASRPRRRAARGRSCARPGCSRSALCRRFRGGGSPDCPAGGRGPPCKFAGEPLEPRRRWLPGGIHRTAHPDATPAGRRRDPGNGRLPRVAAGRRPGRRPRREIVPAAMPLRAGCLLRTRKRAPFPCDPAVFIHWCSLCLRSPARTIRGRDRGAKGPMHRVRKNFPSGHPGNALVTRAPIHSAFISADSG